MPRPRENPRVKKALDLLNAVKGIKAIKVHGSVYQQRGNPDIFGSCLTEDGLGHTFVAEMKTELGHLSALQIQRLHEWKAVGAMCIVSTDAQEVFGMVIKKCGNW